MSASARPSVQDRPSGADAGPRPARHRSWQRTVLVLVVVLAAAALVFWWARRPWAWSLVDDPSYRIAALQGHGLLDRLHSVLALVVGGDWKRGLWRPMYWTYTAVLFQFGPATVHGARLAFLLVAFGGILVAAARRLAGTTVSRRWAVALVVWFASVLASNASAWDQLWWDAQEVPAAAFVGAGLIARGRWTRTCWWLLAAWVRAPYSWVLVAWGLALLWDARGRDMRARLVALLPAVLGLTNLVVTFAWTRHGIYAQTVHPSMANVAVGAQKAATVLTWPALALLAGVVLLRIDPRSLVPRDATTRACLGGAVLYLANLVPYGGGPSGGTYYFTALPILLTAAVALAVSARPGRVPAPEFEPVRIRRALDRCAVPMLCAALSAPVGLATLIATDRLGDVRALDATVRRTSAWINGLPEHGSGVVVGISSAETTRRFAQLRLLAGDGGSRNEVIHVDSGAPVDRSVNFYVQMDRDGPGNPRYEHRLVARFGGARAWEPSPPRRSAR